MTKAKQRKTTVNTNHNLETETPLSDSLLKDDNLYQMISEAAYYRAEDRDFEPGSEINDWLEAELEIKSLYGEFKIS